MTKPLASYLNKEDQLKAKILTYEIKLAQTIEEVYRAQFKLEELIEKAKKNKRISLLAAKKVKEKYLKSKTP